MAGAPSPHTRLTRVSRRHHRLLLRARIAVSVDGTLCLAARKETQMEVMHERCCGVDVHKQFITACLIVPGSSGKATKEVQTFRTMTADLERFRDWLLAAGCTHVAMESPLPSVGACTGSPSTTCSRKPT